MNKCIECGDLFTSAGVYRAGEGPFCTIECSFETVGENDD